MFFSFPTISLSSLVFLFLFLGSSTRFRQTNPRKTVSLFLTLFSHYLTLSLSSNSLYLSRSIFFFLFILIYVTPLSSLSTCSPLNLIFSLFLSHYLSLTLTKQRIKWPQRAIYCMEYAPSTNTLGLHLVRFKFPAAGRGGLNILSVQAESNKTVVLYYLVSQNTFRTWKETTQ